MVSEVKSKKRRANAISQLERARDGMRERNLRLSAIEVVLQVQNAKDARSPEVLEFSAQHLASGGTWEELRRKLGLGTSNIDHRWRAVREAVCNHLMPVSEEEALLAQANQRVFFVGKLESFIEDIEALLLTTPATDEGLKVIPNFMKLKLETFKIMLSENTKSFAAYVETKKVRQADKRTQGTSIIIQNNYHVNRPGDRPQDVRDTTTKISALIGEASGAHPRK